MSNYYQSVTQTRNYSTRFISDNNLAVMKCNKSLTQQSIQRSGCKNQNDLPEKAKTRFLSTDTSFWFHIKRFLIETQI